jgi:hypothetical protein
MSAESYFKKGNPGGPGRTVGSRNKLQHKFLSALQADFEENGEKVIKICRIERPHEYLKLIAGLMPRELLITDNVLEDMTDEQLLETIREVRRIKAEKLAATVPPPADDAAATKH